MANGQGSVITMKQLLEAGVHFGHQTKRWNPKMKRRVRMDGTTRPREFCPSFFQTARANDRCTGRWLIHWYWINAASIEPMLEYS